MEQNTIYKDKHFKDLQDKKKTFRAIANSVLRGTTFDARHLDNFLNSEYGDKPQYTSTHLAENRSIDQDTFTSLNKPALSQTKDKRTSKSIMPHQVQTNIRPTCTFISVARDERKETNIGTSYKPSILTDVKPTWDNPEEKAKKSIYAKERESLKKEFDEEKLVPDSNDTTLKSSKQRRKEMEDFKANQQKYKEFKDKKAFLGKRERLVTNGWRTGIVGVDNINQKDTVFYQKDQREKLEKEMRSMQVQQNRNQVLLKNVLPNPSLEMNNPQFSFPQENEQIKVVPGWVSKKVSEIRYQDTHSHLFQPLEAKYNAERAEKLKMEDSKGKKFNIINGGDY